ncbi:MAG TPA: META domain-containing protein [Woeseiaceae bacterium]
MLSRQMMTLWCLLIMALCGCAEDNDATSRPDASSTDAHATAHGQIIGKTWMWTRTITPVETVEVAKPERYTMLLGMDGRAVLRFDCNRGGGVYEIGEGTIKFGPMMSTRAACPPDSQDHIYMKQLSEVASFFTMEDRLYLEMPMDSGTLHFAEVPESAGPGD